MAQHRTIAVFLPALGGNYFGIVLAGIHDVARQQGAQLLAIEGTPQATLASGLASDRVDGWVAVVSTDGVEALAQHGRPVITVAALAPGLDCPAVLPDNYGGIRQAIDHLVEHGHRRIAFVGNLEMEDIRQRHDGYQAALAAHGISFDPRLVFLAPDDDDAGGRAAAHAMIEAGMPATAVVAATDENAIGVLGAIQAAGYRIPEDVAVVGFDDIDLAQYTSPPLTTVRQRPDALGRKAAQVLLDQIDGRSVPAGPIAVPTALVRRRSCGCGLAHTIPLQEHDPVSSGWRDRLANELVVLACHPLAPDPATPPAQIWPEIGELIRGVEAAARGEPLPHPASLEQAWRQAVALTIDLESLQGMLKLLEYAGMSRIEGGTDPYARARLAAFLEQAHLDLMRARLVREIERSTMLERLVQSNHQISMRLLGAEVGNAHGLHWLDQTPVTWGCLGVWEQNLPVSAPMLTVVGAYSRTNIATPIGQRYPAAAFPPNELLPESAQPGGPDIVVLLPVRASERDTGVLVLCGPLDNQTATDNMVIWAAMLGTAIEREELAASFADQQETLRVAYERERDLANMVRELGCPVIPLLEDVLLVPLVGPIDSDRAQLIIEGVLEGVSSHHATVVLLDITGVPLVDTHVANSLIQAARAATLLGARVILVGVRPEIAQSIVGLGIDLSYIATRPTLAEALKSLQRRLRRDA